MLKRPRLMRGRLRAVGVIRAIGGLAALLGAGAGSVSAQELEPRAYSPSPVGATFLAVSATRSAGGVFTDPSAPLADVEARLGICGVAVGHTFALLGKSALILGVVPIAWGTASGRIGEDRLETSRRGFADPRLKLSVILAGSRPMTAAEFARARRVPIVGTSITVVPPLGQYDAARLVNLGANRWSFKPEIGLSLPLRRWAVDAYGGLWIFTDNNHYFPGEGTRRQDVVLALQSHVSYTLARRAWLAANATWYVGGKSTVDGAPASGAFHNMRIGGTLAVPIGRRQSVKLAFSEGATTRLGADFRTITAAWQVLIF